MSEKSTASTEPPVREPRLAVTAEDYDEALRFHRDVLGLAEPTRTPWNSLNARLEAPAGVQLTIFSELEDQGESADEVRGGV